MVRFASQLAVAVSIASFVSAAPAQVEKVVTIPVRKGTSGKSFTAKDVVERDLARIAAFNDKSGSLSARAGSGTAINEDVTYVAAVTICQQTFDLIVDTGSSNTWVCVFRKSSLIKAVFLMYSHLFRCRQARAPKSPRRVGPAQVIHFPCLTALAPSRVPRELVP